MKNFIAFRFTDNDFHEPLRKAVTYVVENRTEDLSIDAWREFVISGMVAFHELRRIDMFSYENKPERWNSREYFNKFLTVSEVEKLEDIKNFEGYVFDTNTYAVFYHDC